MKKIKLTHCIMHSQIKLVDGICPICNLSNCFHSVEKRIEALEQRFEKLERLKPKEEKQEVKESEYKKYKKDLEDYLSFMLPEKCTESIWIIRDSIRELMIKKVEKDCCASCCNCEHIKKAIREA